MTAQDIVIVFARYPEPGKVKSRLVPALGAELTCQVYRAMAAQTLDCVRNFAREREVEWQVHFTGGDAELMRACFGQGRYVAQEGETLGARLATASRAAFGQGFRRVLLIGTDCLDLTSQDFVKAFDTLQQHDAVVGPAEDGGYYLLGIQQYTPQWFESISWGTDRVLSETRAVARRLGLTIASLRTLHDVDYVDDLLRYRQTPGLVGDLLPQWVSGRLSIVIPALNEAAQLGATLKSIGKPDAETEIVLVDGGSHDATCDIATAWGCRVIKTPPGRARQMNSGATLATGQTFLFLHADTRLPPAYRADLESCLHNDCRIGAFRLAIDTSRTGLRWVAWGANMRSRWLSLPYGDQGLFMRAEDFYSCGGFPRLPIMEDLELVRRLRSRGRVRLTHSCVRTSARRWLKKGACRTVFLNQLFLIAYAAGVSPARIAAWYRAT